MKHLRSIVLPKKLFFIVAPIAFICSSSMGFTNKTFYCPRSQGTTTVRDEVGWESLINRPATDNFYTAFAITPAYTRSFRPQEFVDFLLGCPTATISGSQVADRGELDILGDYFGLAPDFKSVLCFEPRITDFVLDLSFYFGLDQVLNGLYVRLNAPITQTTWNLNMQEFIKNQGVGSYPAGYLSNDDIANKNLTQSATDYFNGKAIFGDMKEPLRYGKIFQRHTESRIAELRGVFGYNWTSDWYHAGFNARVAAPTGTRPEAEFLFEAIAGNGKHWEVGGGLTTHVKIWQNCDQSSDLALYGEANIVHLCAAGQKRSFDFLHNGFGSRYMLVQEMSSPSHNLFAGGAPASGEYRGFLAPAVNYTTLDLKTSFGVQADIDVRLSCRRQGLSLDFGYNFYGRSAEHMIDRCILQSNLYALKGDAQLYGFDSINESPVALNATQHNATLHAGQGAGNSTFANLNADFPANAFDVSGPLFQLTTADAAALGIAQVTVKTSDPSVLLQDCDLDVCSALLPSTVSHALFFHIGHVWKVEDATLNPFLGFGSNVEWAQGHAPSTYSQWGIWAKGGVAF
ncbi:MAG: hypothetical protein P4L31_02245 [Candidatus Babeliales bacterium]|nr:hypothetical protein [Candidatus Babeliales bacterium]